MGLQLSKEETFYHRKNFYETLKVHGTPCKICSINDEKSSAYDFYNDIREVETAYDDSIDSFITYEEKPQIKTLKSLGWYSDTEQITPIAYIPILYVDAEGEYANFSPSIDDKIIIESNVWDDIKSTGEFLIKDFVSNGFPNTIYYTCKLVPVRTNQQEET